LEIHLVHVDEAGNPALVVGIFVRAGAPNTTLETLFSKLPHHQGETVDLPSVSIDLANLLPQSRGFLHYKGSLTTPPCTEGIRWYVMDSPIQMSQEQIAAFTSVPHMDGSDRPTQPLNGRTLEQGAGR
jgi:carbonic anhydrase